MRETSFIQQNEAKWRSFEQLLGEGGSRDPERLGDLFAEVTDDLSHARTFYPNRSVRVYLNGLAQRVFAGIYKSKKSRRSRFTAFWTDELPRLLYDARRDLLLSFLVFAAAVAVGALSSAADPDFLQSILGERYVEMTKENIRSGDPMAVYKQGGAFNSFLGITLNNLLVALQTFFTGIFYGIGTVGSLLYNGVMLGAFQYFFIERGLFLESFLAVWLHGAFELSSIVVAGAAGLTMGRGLAFPGTLPRLRSFQLAARRGMSLLLGTVPLFVLAGFTESYLTRHTGAPGWLRGAFIFGCLAFVAFYFVIFPKMRVRRSPAAAAEDLRLAPDVERRVDFSAVKTTGELFTDAFVFYRKTFKPAALAAACGSALYCAGAFLGTSAPPTELFFFPEELFGTFSALPRFFANERHDWLFPLATLGLAAVAWVVHAALAREAAAVFSAEAEPPAGGNWTKKAMGFVRILAVTALLNLLGLVAGWLVPILLLLALPLLFLWMQAMLSEGWGLLGGLGRAWRLAGGAFGQMLGLSFALMICGALFFALLDTSLFLFLLDVLSMNFYFSPQDGQAFATVLSTFLSMFALMLVFGLWAAGGGLQYFSNLEMSEARCLKEKISRIQPQHRIRGLEREDG